MKKIQRIDGLYLQDCRWAGNQAGHVPTYGTTKAIDGPVRSVALIRGESS